MHGVLFSSLVCVIYNYGTFYLLCQRAPTSPSLSLFLSSSAARRHHPTPNVTPSLKGFGGQPSRNQKTDEEGGTKKTEDVINMARVNVRESDSLLHLKLSTYRWRVKVRSVFRLLCVFQTHISISVYWSWSLSQLIYSVLQHCTESMVEHTVQLLIGLEVILLDKASKKRSSN